MVDGGPSGATCFRRDAVSTASADDAVSRQFGELLRRRRAGEGGSETGLDVGRVSSTAAAGTTG